MERQECPTVSGDEQLDEAQEQPQQRAILVHYQKYQGTGRSPTGAEVKILGTLTSRGFVVETFGTAEGKEPSLAYLTILLGPCDEQKYLQAIQQIEKIVPVISAEARGLRDVVQHMRARLIGIDGDERKALRRDHRASLDEAFNCEVKEREKRKPTRTLERLGVKVVDVKRGRFSETGERKFQTKILVRNVSDEARQNIAGELGGEWSEKSMLTLTADVLCIERLMQYLRSKLSEKIDVIQVNAPRASLENRKVL